MSELNEEDRPLRGNRDNDMLLYDYLKHITSLSVLALGGILLLVQNIDPASLRHYKVVLTFLLVSMAGISAFHGAAEIVRLRSTDKPLSTGVTRIRTVAPLSLAAGVGVFLSLFMDALELL